MFTSDRIVRGEMTSQYDKPAFVCLWPEKINDKDEPGSYREVDPQRILREVLRRRGE